MKGARSTALVRAAVFALPLSAVTAQGQSSAGGFVPGSREIYAMDLASVPAGGLPKGVTLLRGKASIVTKDGAPMLKAAEPAEFLVSLPEVLPDGFTIEFELTPKSCCAPEDISFEGTREIARSPTSMHVVWWRESMIAIGGGDYVQTDMPQELKEILPSALTQLAASFQGTSFKLYTNGRKVLDLPNKRFAHGRVLRVFLGGQDNDANAVYLSKLRIAATSGAVASTTSPDLAGAVASGATGTLVQATGTQPIGTVLAPTATSVATPTNPGVTAGPLPAGTVTSPSSTLATQPSSPTNPLPVVSTTTTATQQQASTTNGLASPGSRSTSTATTTTTAPTATTKTVSGTTSATTPGPAMLTAVDLRSTNGFGVQLKWNALPGITQYVVSRKLELSSDPARYVNVILVPSTDASSVTAIDPYVDPNTRYTYWVAGFTSTAGETQPSPIANVTIAMNPPFAPSAAKVTTVSAPQMRSMPGVLAASSPMLGSAVTWEWTKVINVDVYHVSYEIVGGFSGVGPVFVRSLVTTFGAATPPPMTVNVPQGKTVKLCVHLYASADLTAALPSGATCTQATAP